MLDKSRPVWKVPGAWLMCCVPGLVWSQEHAPVIEQVTVTATRREESLERVPIALSVLGGEEMKERSMSRLTDITQNLPNVAFVANNDLQSSTAFTIRGFSTTSNNTGVAPGVGLYVDGVYMARNIAFDSALNDAARVEVLRGPQGTQFGRNAVQGAINIVTSDPTGTPAAELALQTGNYDLIDVRTRVSGPLGGLLGSVSAYYRDRQGFLDNPAQGTHLNGEHYWGGRVKLIATPTAALTVKLSIDGQRDDTTANGRDVLPNIDFSTSTNGVYGRREYFVRDIFGAALDMHYDWRGHEVVATSGYRYFDSDGANDQDFTTLRLLDQAGRREKGDYFTQELRLQSPSDGRLTYIAGLFFMDQGNDTLTRGDLGPQFALPNRQVRAMARQDVRSYAGFGNATVEIVPRWRVTGGLRLTRDEQTLDFEQVSDAQPAFASVAPLTNELKHTELSPLVTLAWQARPELMAYATFSKAYKAGGFNTTFVSNATQANKFEPEYLTNYEIGVKGRLWDDRVRSSLTVFYQDYKDQQLSVFAGVLQGFLIRNAANSVSKGVELELEARPHERIRLSTAIGYNDAYFEEFPLCAGAGTTCSGKEAPSPRFNGSISASYDHPLASFGLLRFRVDGYREDAYYNDVRNTIRATDKNLLNARLSLLPEMERWEVALWGSNLTDDRYSAPVPNSFAGGFTTPLPTPRMYGLDARLRL